MKVVVTAQWVARFGCFVQIALQSEPVVSNSTADCFVRRQTASVKDKNYD